MTYPVKAVFGKHNIVEGEELLQCEPNEVPDKAQPHQRAIEFDKSPKKVKSYRDGISLNEKRFDSINKEPKISSNAR